MKKLIPTLIALLVVILFSIQYSQAKNETIEVTNLKNKQLYTFEKENNFYVYNEVVVGGIGDILIHDRVYDEVHIGDGKYDFSERFSRVKDLLQGPDFLIANQESVPGGVEIGLSSYPSFNSPQEIIDTLIDSGVDMVTTANNHTLDRGEKAILSAIDYYEKVDLPYTGSYKSPEDKAEIRVFEINDISFAVLAYAEHFNGIPIPQGKEYLVSPLVPEQVEKDIDLAEEQADFVILALHWGDEYIRQPNQNQRNLADRFITYGADVIIGHHPHVLQPMQWIDKPDGGQGLVIYSLGNFYSGQIRDYKDLGGMVEFTLFREGSGNNTELGIKDVKLHPTFVHTQNWSNFTLYPLEEAEENNLTNYSSKAIQEFFKEVK